MKQDSVSNAVSSNPKSEMGLNRVETMESVPPDTRAEITQKLSELRTAVKAVTDRNLFSLQNEASALEYSVRDLLDSLVSLTYNKSKLSDIFWNLVIGRVEYIQGMYKATVSSLDSSSSFTQLTNMIKDLNSIILRCSTENDLIELIRELNPEVSRAITNPSTFIEERGYLLLGKLRKAGVKTMESSEFSRRLRMDLDEFPISISEDAISTFPQVKFEGKTYMLCTALEDLIPEFLTSIQRSEMTFSEILGVVNMDEITVKIVLNVLEDDGRVIRDRDAGSGEIIYFPEFS